MTTKISESKLTSELSRYFSKGSKLNEAVYEMMFSGNADEDLKTLEYLRKLPPDHIPLSSSLLREFILSMFLLKGPRERVLENHDLNVRSNTMMEGNVKCRYCGSSDTIFTLRQTRSSDEAPTLILFCNACGRRSTAEDDLQ